MAHNNPLIGEYKKLAVESIKKAADAKKHKNMNAHKQHLADAKWYMSEFNRIRAHHPIK